MTADSLIDTAETDGVFRITLNSPADGNTLSLRMTAELVDAIARASQSDSARCLVLRSSTKVFCAGGNVKDMLDRTDLMAGSRHEIHERLVNQLQALPRALAALSIPTLAVINGAAYGAGLDLALMCDVRIASTEATMSESFVRLGLVSGIGGSWYLARVVGPSKALELSLTSEVLKADRAAELGIVAEVSAPAQLDETEQRWTAALTAHPRRATAMTKRLVREAASRSLEDTFALAAEYQAAALVSEEHQHALAQFFQRDRTRKESPAG